MATGDMHITLDDVVVGVGSEAQGFLSRARDLLNGIDALAISGANVNPASHFLAGWTLELILKSYLSHRGFTQKQLRGDPLGHDLCELWAKAISNNFQTHTTPPVWCEQLNSIHDYPYHARYPTQLSGYAGSNIVYVASELRTLLVTAEKSIS